MRQIARSVLCLLAAVVLSADGARTGRGPVGDEMSAAAQRLLDALSPALRARCNLAFEGRERLDWHFVPRQRAGVTLAEITDEQRAAARGLLRAALSTRGVLKAEGIMELDSVLREMEQAAGRDGSERDPLAYSVAVFGSPAGDGPWGWKIEGHHLSLNFTSATRLVTAVTPSFLGANPAEVRRGAKAGLRVLAAEEDLARALLASLEESQRAEAVIAAEAPRDILTLPGRPLDSAPPIGLPVSKMTPAQRDLVERLLDEYAGNLRHELAAQEMDRIRHAGIENIRFAWAGGAEPGQGHYYRLTGPTFVIEYDNTQDGANHVHTVWHDRERDFGHDLLKEHYEKDQHAK